MTATLDAILTAAPVIAVVTFDDPQRAVDATHALQAGGIRAIEVTLRTPNALACVRAIHDAIPDALVGIGTALRIEDIERGADAGARFAVSPGLTPTLLTQSKPIAWLPGIATASELMMGLEAGLSRFKLFPAQAVGGLALLDGLAAPFPQARFCPTGGVTQDNAAAYLARGNVVCVGGSWLAPPDLVAAGDWAEITRRAAAAATLHPRSDKSA